MLNGAWAQLLMSLTGHHDVAFGTTVSGRPAEVTGSESIVGLLANTVPVRATVTSSTTTADLLSQLQRAHNHTLEHQHLALSEIHRITGHERLFDTLFVYENYPIDTAALFGGRELTVTEFVSHESTHYPLTLAAVPGPEIELRLKFRTDVFDLHTIEALIDRFQQILLAMTSDPTRRLRRWICCAGASTHGWDVGQPGGAGPACHHRSIDSGVVRRAGGPNAGCGGADLRGSVDDLSRT